MKLNNKQTFIVGLAFLSICAFWQMYDNIIPLILTTTFKMNETLSGAIMAIDNVLALFYYHFLVHFQIKPILRLVKECPSFYLVLDVQLF